MTGKRTRVAHAFVDHIPAVLDEGVIYASIEFGTVVHLCCCGCGEEVVTPLTPTDWKLIYDGETVSLYPSIGSWSLPCRSHYVIAENRVRWASEWPEWKVRAGRVADQQRKQRHYEAKARGERAPGGAGLREIVERARFRGGPPEEE